MFENNSLLNDYNFLITNLNTVMSTFEEFHNRDTGESSQQFKNYIKFDFQNKSDDDLLQQAFLQLRLF